MGWRFVCDLMVVIAMIFEGLPTSIGWWECWVACDSGVVGKKYKRKIILSYFNRIDCKIKSEM